ncbi:MAG TPA: EAL domain-containing protein, partial [Candidatus Dormibacteraeota bacterium]
MKVLWPFGVALRGEASNRLMLRHPTRGLLNPDAFLALVEEFGLMPSLTRVVLALALDQAEAWHTHGRPL